MDLLKNSYNKGKGPFFWTSSPQQQTLRTPRGAIPLSKDQESDLRHLLGGSDRSRSSFSTPTSLTNAPSSLRCAAQACTFDVGLMARSGLVGNF